MGTLKIELLGTSFSIKASEDDDYLKKLLGYYKNIVDEIQKSGMLKSELHISILAGIMLCDELYKKNQKAQFLKNLRPATKKQKNWLPK